MIWKGSLVDGHWTSETCRSVSHFLMTFTVRIAPQGMSFLCVLVKNVQQMGWSPEDRHLAQKPSLGLETKTGSWQVAGGKWPIHWPDNLGMWPQPAKNCTVSLTWFDFWRALLGEVPVGNPFVVSFSIILITLLWSALEVWLRSTKP